MKEYTKNTKTINRKFSLSEYDPSWVIKFESIKNLVSRVFGDKALKIEHVGSTAIQGMRAKPLIDILVLVEKLEPFEKEKELMIEAGYEWRYYTAPAGAILFFKFNTDGEKLENIHVCEESSPMVSKFIVVRDYLRTHPGKAKEYSELKQRNIELYPDDYPAYRNAKAPFLERIKKEADKWEKNKKLN